MDDFVSYTIFSLIFLFVAVIAIANAETLYAFCKYFFRKIAETVPERAQVKSLESKQPNVVTSEKIAVASLTSQSNVESVKAVRKKPTEKQKPLSVQKIRKKDWVCIDCRMIGKPKYYTPGSIFIELVLWCLIIPGLIYTLWRHSAKKKMCRYCGSFELVSPTTPRGREIIER